MLEDYASLCEEYSNNQISHQQQQVIDFSPFEEDPSEINQHVRKEKNVDREGLEQWKRFSKFMWLYPRN